MGNCGSEEARQAIYQDGQQNVRKTAIAEANQAFLQNYISEQKKLYKNELQKRIKLKNEQISQTRDKIDQKYKQRKIQLQSQETGMIQHLETKYGETFGALSGYDHAIKKIQEFKNRAQQIFAAQGKKIFDDIDIFKKDIVWQVEKLKHPLPSLMGLGLTQRDKILSEVATQHPDEVNESNKQLQDHFQEQFNFDQIYRKRCEEWLMKDQLDQIVTNFENDLKLKEKRQKNHYFGCI